ncbi:MAG: hypothetical protein V4731_16790 [Pseudomonadota bacterium]
MKKLLLVSCFSSLVASTAFAGTKAGLIDVDVYLTPSCEINQDSNPGPLALSNLSANYTSFQRDPVIDNRDFAIRCTNQLPYTVTLVRRGETTPETPGPITDSVLNLTYSLNLALGAGYVAGTANALAPAIGSGVDQTYAVSLTIASDLLIHQAN